MFVVESEKRIKDISRNHLGEAERAHRNN